MGAGASISEKRYAADYSVSTEETESRSVSLRNSRSNSIAVSSNSSYRYIPSLNLVKPNFLAVPSVEGHPSGEYLYLKQIGRYVEIDEFVVIFNMNCRYFLLVEHSPKCTRQWASSARMKTEDLQSRRSRPRDLASSRWLTCSWR